MRILSTNVNAGKATGQPVYLVHIERIDAGELFLSSPISHYDDDAAQLYSGDRIAAGGMGAISASFRAIKGGGVGSISDWTLKLSNADLYSDTFEANQWEMAEIEVRLTFADHAGAFWGTAAPLFKGRIEQVSFDSLHLVLKCKSAWKAKHHDLLADDLLTEEEFPNLPEDSVGAPVPVIYGDFYGSPVHKTALPAGRFLGIAGFDYRPYRDHFRGYRVDELPQATNSVVSLVLCRHAMYKYPGDGEPDDYYFRTNISGFWFGCGTPGTVAFAAGRTKCTGAQLYGIILKLIPSKVIENSGGSSIGGAVNENVDDYGTIGDWPDGYSKIGWPLPDFSPWSESYILTLYGRSCKTQGASGVQLKIELYDEDDVLLSWSTYNVNNSWPGFTYTATMSPGLALSADTFKPGCYLKLINQHLTATIYLKNLYCIFNPTMAPDVEDVFYFEGKGRMYGSWITGRTHALNDLIENPSGTVESLLRDELGLVTAEVNEDAFDAIDALRSGWSFARQLVDVEDSLSLVKAMAFEAGIGYTEDYLGREYPFRLTPIGTPATIGDADIREDVKKGLPVFSVNKTSIGDLRSVFRLYYKPSAESGNHEELVYCDKDDSNLTTEGTTYEGYCQDIYDDYSLETVWEYKAEWIRDKATADLFLKWVIEWLTYKGAGIRLQVKMAHTLSMVELEIGDRKKVTQALLPTIANQTQWLCTKLAFLPEKDEIRSEWLEIGPP